MKILTTLIFFCTPTLLHAELFKATVLERESGKKLFSFEKKIKLKGKLREAQSTYLLPDGKKALEDRLIVKDGLFSDYKRTQHQINEKIHVRREGDQLKFLRHFRGKKEEDSDDFEPSMIVAEQIGNLIRKNWKKLNSGAEVEFRMIVPSRMDTFGFDLTKHKLEKFKGKEVLIVKMEASSFFVKQVIDPIYIYMETDSKHKLVMVDGRLPVKKFKGEKFNDWVAKLVFD